MKRRTLGFYHLLGKFVLLVYLICNHWVFGQQTYFVKFHSEKKNLQWKYKSSKELNSLNFLPSENNIYFISQINKSKSYLFSESGCEFVLFDAENNHQSQKITLNEKEGILLKNCFKVNYKNFVRTSEFPRGGEFVSWMQTSLHQQNAYLDKHQTVGQDILFITKNPAYFIISDSFRVEFRSGAEIEKIQIREQKSNKIIYEQSKIFKNLLEYKDMTDNTLEPFKPKTSYLLIVKYLNQNRKSNESSLRFEILMYLKDYIELQKFLEED